MIAIKGLLIIAVTMAALFVIGMARIIYLNVRLRPRLKRLNRLRLELDALERQWRTKHAANQPKTKP